MDKEYVRLLQDIQSEQIPGHIYRGYVIKSKDITNKNSMDLQVSFNYLHLIFVKLLIVLMNIFI